MKYVDPDWVKQTKGRKYFGHIWGNLTKGWALSNVKELLLISLVVMMVLWLCKQMSLLFRGECQGIQILKN